MRGGFWILRPICEPVVEVVAHVVAAEGQHGEGVPAHFADVAGGGGGHLAADGGGGVDAEVPVHRLHHQRHGGGAAAAEDEGADGHAVGVLPGGVDGGALRRGGGEAAVGVGRLAAAVRGSRPCPASR